MQNAKEEYLKHTSGKKVLCAFIEYEPDHSERNPYVLPCGFSELQLLSFLQSLNFEYDSEYGGHELFGHIWYKDGKWSDRREYDGSEWWNYCHVPEIPKECAANTKEQNGHIAQQPQA